METRLKSIKKILPRRSPRLMAQTYLSGSTSMQDLGLHGADKLSLPQIKHQPKIRGFNSDSDLKHEKQRRALKRMREKSVSLRSIENSMPIPLKKIKSSQDEVVKNLIKASVEHQVLEPNKKKFTSKVAQFARGLSPKKSFKKRSNEDLRNIQRSSSLRLPKVNQPFTAPSISRSSSRKYKQTTSTPTRRTGSKLWVETVASLDVNTSDWTPQQIKRQEVIYELYCGEADLVEDLKLLQEVYFNPISKLKLLSDADLNSIFGNIQALLPLHEDLVKRLESVRSDNGSIEHIGKILMEWIPTLRPYIPYCANQLQTKDILFQKVKENEQFSDFLERCQASPFSRKLDLWSFLDSPRSRLVKYPLLVSNIHKNTPKDHPDRALLYRTNKQLETLIKEADRQTGISKCGFYKEQLYFLEDNEYKSALDDAKTLVCHGCLKNKSGSKMEAFLFDTIFTCTRLVTRSGNKVYQVFNQPLLTHDMEVADISDGEIRLGGSFRTSLSKGAGAKNAFRVFTRDWARGKSVILLANDPHDKKQWLTAFQSVISQQSQKSDSVENVDSESSSELTYFKVPEAVGVA